MSEIVTPPCPGCGERFAARGDMMALLKAHDAWKEQHAHPVPAVPVGVQPEPAEEADVMAIAASEAKRWQPLLDRLTDDPAVPVVHPEPGDRAEDAVGAMLTWLEAWQADVAAEGLALFAAAVAAVAAVRADTEHLLSQHPDLPDPTFDPRRLS